MKPSSYSFQLAAALLLATVAGPFSATAAPTDTYDVVVYGGTAAGVIAAVQAKRIGKTAIVVSPDIHLGGLSSGGLGWTDTGNKAVIGGLARDFYHRVWKEYQKPESWKWQKQADYGNKGQGTPAIDGDNRTMWIFEPHVAETIFEDYVKEYAIPVLRDGWLNRETGVAKESGRITSITTLDGQTVRGKMFIDATYEGDLMAAAGVSYHVGREAEQVYGEEWNGIQVGILHHRHHFGAVDQPISAYKSPADPSSGVLARISTEPPGVRHGGDKRIQAYCFRMCLTDAPENRIPFPKPEGYDPSQYELLLRVFAAGWRETFHKFDPLPNHKTDTNNHGPFSTDNIGYNYDYPEASYERRREIILEHERYQKGWLWFIANDPRVPKEVQEEMQRWGLPKDEFTDHGNWSHQLYIREARRLVGAYVMTEHELRKRRPTPDSVGMGSYTIDSHNVQRYITPEGNVQNEGDIGVHTEGPYEIAYGSLIPKREECANLLVPVCVSSSHIAFGSIRMEPVFMILAQSAATAAGLALDANLAVQDVPYPALRAKLETDGQILQYAASAADAEAHARGLDPKSLPGAVVDDDQAILFGTWQSSGAASNFVGHGYRHEGKGDAGPATARFEAKLPKAGRYEVRMTWPANTNRASNVPITVEHANGKDSQQLNQKVPSAQKGGFSVLGTFSFTPNSPATVVVGNQGADGYVVIDAVQWIEVP